MQTTRLISLNFLEQTGNQTVKSAAILPSQCSSLFSISSPATLPLSEKVSTSQCTHVPESVKTSNSLCHMVTNTVQSTIMACSRGDN